MKDDDGGTNGPSGIFYYQEIGVAERRRRLLGRDFVRTWPNGAPERSDNTLQSAIYILLLTLTKFRQLIVIKRKSVEQPRQYC